MLSQKLNTMKKSTAAVIAILLAIIIGLVWNMIEAEEQSQTWQTSYPMANAHISWEQTHHPGPWGGVNDGH